MAKKPYAYAVLEGVAQEMRTTPTLSMNFGVGSAVPTAVSVDGKVLDLTREFGYPRTPPPGGGPIDEAWHTGWGAGMAMTGCPAIVRYPSMANLFGVEYIFNQIGKLRHMTGGQAAMPIVLWLTGAGRTRGSAGQHTDVGIESVYTWIPGLKVVVPSNAYDAKGLMIAAIRDPDPVAFIDYAEVASGAQPDVPDEAYAVPIGKAEVRQEGKDLTIVAWAPASLDVAKALPEIAKAGISVEFIDPRSLKPLDVDTLVNSVKKTGRLLVVDHGYYTNGFGSHVIAAVAQQVTGAKVKKLSFPDAPGPGAGVMMAWMRPDAPKIIDAAKQMLKS